MSLDKEFKWLDKIIEDRESLREGYEKNPRHFKGIKKDYSEGRYTDDLHFIIELIQNADDQKASKASFIINKDEIIFHHNGKNFNEDDVESITTPRDSKKTNDPNKIGKYGIGFFSVYSICECPIIYSSRKGKEFYIKISDFFFPSILSIKEIKKFETRIKKNNTFFFLEIIKNKKNILTKEDITDFINREINNSLLFLRHIKQLSFSLFGIKYIFEIRRSGFYSYLRNNIGNKTNKLKYFVYSNKIKINSTQGESISVAFKMKNKEFIPEDKPTNFYVYFPTDQKSYRKFIINAPFDLDTGRALFKKNNNVNESLLTQCGEVVRNALIFLREKKLLNLSFLKIIGYPYTHEEEDEASVPITASIRKIFSEDEIWQCQNNTYSSTKNTYIIKQSLKKKKNFDEIFSQYNLKILFNKKKFYHLIESNKNEEKFALDFGVKGIDQEMIIEKIEENDFIQTRKIVKNKNNKWLIKFYFLLLNIKFQNTEFPLVKAEDNKFYKGPLLRFKTNLVIPEVLNLHSSFYNYKNKKDKYLKKLRSFFEKLGVTDTDDWDMINQIYEKNYRESEKLKVSLKKYAEHMNMFINNKKESKIRYQFESKKIFIDNDLNLRSYDELYIDDIGYRTNLNLIYLQLKNLNKYQIKIPKHVDKSLFINFAKQLGVQYKYEIEQVNIYNNQDLKFRIQDQGFPTGNMIPYKFDYNFPHLEELFSSQNLKISKIICDKLNQLNERYFRARYSKSQTSPTIKGKSTLVCDLEKFSWIPNKNGKLCKPNELNIKTIDKNFYKQSKKSKYNWLEIIGFNKDNTKKEKKIIELMGKNRYDSFKRFEGLSPEQLEFVESLHKEKANEQFEKLPKSGYTHKRIISSKNLKNNYPPHNISLGNAIKNKDQSRKKSNKIRKKRKVILSNELHKCYANHCQICLAVKKINILAPKKSYIEDFDDRSNIINIHHLEPIGFKGIDEINNLISLCKKHHSEYGMILDREFIKQALIKGGEEYDPWNNGYEGFIFSVKTYKKSEILKIYFRKEHMEKWIE